MVREAELDFCLRDPIRNVDQYQAGCEMSNGCQNCSCPGRMSSSCEGTWRREGRAPSVTLSRCWLQQFKHTTSNRNHAPIYLLHPVNTIQRVCQESLEVAKKIQHGLHLPVKNNWRCPTLLCLEPLQLFARIFILFYIVAFFALGITSRVDF